MPGKRNEGIEELRLYKGRGAARSRLMLKLNKKVVVRLLVVATSYTGLAGQGFSAATMLELRRTPGVWCERRSEYAITKAHEIRLALSLRRITGFGDLHFAADGSLSLGDPRSIAGGSAEARAVLIRALCLGAIFIIEDYSGSSSVNFGQAAQAEVYADGDGGISEVWRLRLDFDDFEHMQASSEVRAAFDEGFILIHELLHGLRYKDASREGELGACEEIVNRMRSELGLPLRDGYFGETWRITEKLTSVRLRFHSQPVVGSANRRASYYLFFLVTEPAECSSNVRAVTRLQKRSRR